MLKTAFKGQLTSGQQAVVSRMDEFLQSSRRCFLLKGYAGTGKTYILKGLTDYLKSIGCPFRLSAPTGRAAKIISEKTGKPASTIHRMIYEMAELKMEQGDTGNHRYYFDLRKPEYICNTIYIIDESSMISDRYNTSEMVRFGSGRLLSDLLMFMDLNNSELNGKKVIFVGDTAQLPPYGSDVSSPALDIEYFTQGHLESEEYELTEVVRQNLQSGILANASKIRSHIQKGFYNELTIDRNYPDIFAVKSGYLLPSYINACHGIINHSTVIISHSNNQVSDYNKMVRDYFFPNMKSIAVGDKILVTQNNYMHEIDLHNGDFGIITQVDQNIETRNIFLNKPVNGKRNIITVEFNFRRVSISFEAPCNSQTTVQTIISENLLNSKDRDLSADELKALSVDFAMRHDGKDGRPYLKHGSPEFRQALKNDPYYNCLRVKYGYAVTCHKAQGGEWENVFVDFRTSMQLLSQGNFRWLYTAITRSREKLFIINENRAGMFDACRIVNIANDVKQQQNTSIDSLYDAVQECIKGTGIIIDSVRHHQYCDHYFFSKENLNSRTMIYYNARNRITKIRFNSNLPSSFDNEINKALSNLQNSGLLSGTTSGDSEQQTIKPEKPELQITAAEQMAFPDNMPYLKSFFEELEKRITPAFIIIKSFEILSSYHVRVFFQKTNDKACLDYNFNKKGRITYINLQNNLSTSTELLQQVHQLIYSPVTKSPVL